MAFRSFINCCRFCGGSDVISQFTNTITSEHICLIDCLTLAILFTIVVQLKFTVFTTALLFHLILFLVIVINVVHSVLPRLFQAFGQALSLVETA